MKTTGTRPMSFRRSLFFFLIPAAVMFVMFNGVLRVLDYLGIRLFFSFLAVFVSPMLILLLLSIRFYRKEGRRLVWPEFRERFRLRAMDASAWLWTAGLAGFMFGSSYVLDFTVTLLQEKVFEPPKVFVRLFDVDPNYFMEVPLRGNWWIPAGILLFVTLKAFGEEFWWRGYILPRQELAMGSRTWMIHGVLWNCFYAFWSWELIRRLPASLALPYVAQRTKNTIPGIVAQFAINVPWLFGIIRAVLTRD